MKNDTSFLGDLKNFIQVFLLSTGPLILFTDVYIDGLSKIFQLNLYTSYCLYLTSYFFFPVILFCIWSFVLQNIRYDEDLSRVSKIVNYLPAVLILIFVLLFIYPKAFGITLLVITTSTIGYLYFQSRKYVEKRLSSDRDVRKIVSEFWICLVISMTIGALYLGMNWKGVATFFPNDYGPLYTFYPHAFDPHQKARELPDNWKDVIRPTNYLGVFALFNLLGIALAFWLYYSLINKISKSTHDESGHATTILIKTESEGYQLKEGKKFENLSTYSFFTGFVYLIVLLIIPVFQPVQAPKNANHPFINLIGSLRVHFVAPVDPTVDPMIRNDPAFKYKEVDYDIVRKIIKEETKGIRDSLPYLHATFNNLDLLYNSFSHTGRSTETEGLVSWRSKVPGSILLPDPLDK